MLFSITSADAQLARLPNDEFHLAFLDVKQSHLNSVMPPVKPDPELLNVANIHRVAGMVAFNS